MKEVVNLSYNYGEVEAFLDGWKPAIAPTEKTWINELEQKGYPSAISFWMPAERIYFQNEHLKKEYEKNITIKPGHVTMGIALGYPPDTVAVFVESLAKNSEAGERVFLNYYGLQFSTFKNRVQKDLVWLEVNYGPHKNKRGEIKMESI
jgi:hypothetical protein